MISPEPFKRFPLFALLTDQQLASWCASGHEMTCALGETIFQEGTPGGWIYLVREGKIRVMRKSEQRDLTLATLQRGDLFGEYALLPPGRNTATCRAAEAGVLVRLPLVPLRNLLQTFGPVWSNLKNWLRMHVLVNFLRQRAFLGFVSAESGLKLHDRLKKISFAAGQTIQAGALAADRWYFLDQGEVTLHESDESGPVLARLGPGDTFGEKGLAGWSGLPIAVARSEVRTQYLDRLSFEPSAVSVSLGHQSYLPRQLPLGQVQAWVGQETPSECGLASLAMIARRRGMKLGLDDLRRLAKPGPNGLSVQEMRNVAEQIDLRCQAVRVSVDRLGLVTLPAIAHLSDGHYVVLHELGAKGVVIGDPASGVVTTSVPLFARCYSGCLLVFDPPR